MYFLGIDCGTQGTKCVVFDPESGKILSKGYAKHQIIADSTGVREQKAEWWIEALKKSVHEALSSAQITGTQIKALAVSGQQHGLVLLDKYGNVIRNVKLWNDTSTAFFNDEIINAIGSIDDVWRELGTAMPVGFTASKIRYVYKKEHNIWKNTAHVLLPHDYINYYLTGEFGTDSSEASGTGYYDVRHKCYSLKMMHTIDPDGLLEKGVPEIFEWKTPLGKLRKKAADELGLSQETLVAIGGGDNTMGAVGTSAIVSGRCALSLGTSGTVCMVVPEIKEDLDRQIQVYDVIDKRLMTACTLNATAAMNIIQELFGLSLFELDQKIQKAPVGCQGLFVLPYFNGERMPALPFAKGVFKYLTMQNCTDANIIRATAEAVIYTLKWGYDKLLQSFSAPKYLIVTGGGGNSAPWRQIVADVFNIPVKVMKNDEGGAFGAALQAMFCVTKSESLTELCNRYVRFYDEKEVLPMPDNVEKYKEFFSEYKRIVGSEYTIKM